MLQLQLKWAYLRSAIHARLLAIQARPAAVQLVLAPAAEAAANVPKQPGAKSSGWRRGVRTLTGVAHLPVLGPGHRLSSLLATRNAEAALRRLHIPHDQVRRPATAHLLFAPATEDPSPEGPATSRRRIRWDRIRSRDSFDLKMDI